MRALRSLMRLGRVALLVAALTVAALAMVLFGCAASGQIPTSVGSLGFTWNTSGSGLVNGSPVAPHVTGPAQPNYLKRPAVVGMMFLGLGGAAIFTGLPLESTAALVDVGVRARVRFLAMGLGHWATGGAETAPTAGGAVSDRPAAATTDHGGDVTTSAKRPEAIPPQAERYARTLARAWQYYFDLAEPASIGFAQVHQESRWRADARSPVGASGLGQFMPATADWIHELLPAEVQAECASSRGCPEDPRWALEALARFDYFLHRNAGWAGPDRWAVALAGYNGGEGWIGRERRAALERGIPADGWFDKVERVCLRSAAACRENREYPRVILHRWRPLYSGWLGE